MTFTVGQPAFVEAFEQTSIFSKVSGFIKKFDVDIGDKVKEGQVLCEIIVPELEQEHQQKLAQTRLDGNMVKQAEQLVNLAQTKINMAIAEQKEAEANVGKYQAEVVRWESELKRMTEMAAERVIDKQSLDETRKEFESSKSARDASQAAAAARQAAKLFAEADMRKAEIDVETAKSKVEVSEAEERRLAALLEYTKITAPYDGVVTVRNANTGDYVESVSGDKTASGHVPMFVVARTDLARIFVDIPEEHARCVEVGTKAVVCAEALSGQEILGDGGPHLVEPESKDQVVAGGDRSTGQKERHPAGNVRVRQGTCGTPCRPRRAAGCPDGAGQPDLCAYFGEQPNRQDPCRMRYH